MGGLVDEAFGDAAPESWGGLVRQRRLCSVARAPRTRKVEIKKAKLPSLGHGITRVDRQR